MNADELKRVLDAHAKWLRGEKGGQRADLSGADLSWAHLAGYDLRRAVLIDADLRGAKLTGATLSEAKLTGATLSEAALTWTDLRGADLTEVNIDHASWPLWCGSKGVRVDARIAAQLAAHFCVLDCDDPAYQAAREALLPFARTSHRAKDLGLLD